MPDVDDVYVHPTAEVDAGALIGPGSKIWHFSHVMAGARIGANCSLGQNVFVATGARMGDGCKIQNGVSIYEGVELEDDVFCGPSMVFTNVRAPRAAHPTPNGEYGSTLVKRGATIGANATIVCGTTLGAWSFVAAGAVVASDVQPHGLMAGVPARRIGWACECGRSLRFDGRTAKCECGRLYEERDEGIEEVS